MIEEIYEGQKAIGSPYTGFSSVEDENSFYERNQKISTNIDKFVSPENGNKSTLCALTVEVL